MMPCHSILHAFEKQVIKTPHHTAVHFKETRLTYHQLNRKANTLAYCLRGLGVSAETCVAISLNRSMDMIIGLLGILKAGAAYVPLDPDYPMQRLDFMLRDTDARVLLTQSSFKHRFHTLQKPLICLDADWGMIVRQAKQSTNHAE